MESYNAYKQIDPQSAADACAHELVETTTFLNDQRYDVGMLRNDDIIQLPQNPFSSLVPLITLESGLSREAELKKKFAKSISGDLEKGCTIKVSEAHMVEQRSDEVWYLPHYP